MFFFKYLITPKCDKAKLWDISPLSQHRDVPCFIFPDSLRAIRRDGNDKICKYPLSKLIMNVQMRGS